MNTDIKIEYIETREGVQTIKCNEYYLHSKYAPLKESSRLAEEYYKPHHLHVVFGYGLGYLVDELIKKCKFNEPILLVDPLLEEGFLEYKNERKYDRLYYGTLKNVQALRILTEKLCSYTPQVTFITSNNYNHIFPNELKFFIELVRDEQDKQVSNLNTTAYFAMDWQVNYVLNLPSVKNDYSLKQLRKKYDLPVVIASGGPSLTKQLPYIRKYRERIILICAGSTINSLLKANIMPDYVVSIDGGVDNYNHFKDLNLDKTQLIYSPMMHYGIRDVFKNRAFVMIPHVRPALAKHLKRIFNEDYPIIYGGGSVAHFALSIAKYITTGPICLIGQDLAYTDGLTHAIGNNHSKKQNEYETVIEGYNGNEVFSDFKFKIMISTFNEMQYLQKHENVIFNCTEGGAKLEKYDQMPFNEFLNLYTKQEVVLQKYSEKKSNDINREFIWESEKKIYKRILSFLAEGISLVNNNKSVILTQKNVKKVGKIEKELNKLYEETCLDMLLEPILVFAEHQYLPKVNETKEEENMRAKEYIISLYSSCKESIEKYIEKVESILKGNKNG